MRINRAFHEKECSRKVPFWVPKVSLFGSLWGLRKNDRLKLINFKERNGAKMTIEIALLISIISVFFAIFSGIVNMSRNKKQDDKKDAADFTTVLIRLDKISEDTNEIKNDMKSVRADVRHNSEAIIRIDESLKSAWKQINEINARHKRGDE